MKRVLVIDDHAMFHMTLGAAAQAAYDGGCEVITARSLEEAFEVIDACGGVDLTLLDLGLPGCNDLDAYFRYRDKSPDALIVIVSVTDEPSFMVRAIDAGARGYIPKTHDGNMLKLAVRVAASGGIYATAEAWVCKASQRLPSSVKLTARQVEILRLVQGGSSNREIAQRLGIAEDTVKHHLSAIYAALGVSSRTQAVIAAKRLGLPEQ